LPLEIQNLESSKFYLSLHAKIFWYGGGQVTQLFNTLSNTSLNSAVKKNNAIVLSRQIYGLRICRACGIHE